MSTVLDPPPTSTSPPPHRFTGINLADEAFIPAGISDLVSFRRWADSELYPSRGKYSFFQGQLWVDLTMEQLFTHNQVKTELTIEVGKLVRDSRIGYFFSDGVRLSNANAELSSEPDAAFVSFDAIRQGKVKLVRGQLGGYVELEGSPELVVEIVSASSVRKDTEILRELYAKAGVAEYWLIDARSASPTLQILELKDSAFQPTPVVGEQQLSRVLTREVKLVQEADPLGNPRYLFAMAAVKAPA